MEHTKEPWLLNRYGTVHVGDDSRPVVLTGFALNTGHPSPLAESNTRRIVACVNACAEISTATLEQVGLDVGNELVKLKQQRDELLTALERICEADSDIGMWGIASETLTNVKEQK